MKGTKIGLLAIVIAIICAIGVQGDHQPEQELCCVSLVLQEDTYSQDLAAAFTHCFAEKGYRTQIAYCNNDVLIQLAQIENFITLGAKVIAIERVGAYSCYEKPFALAQELGCKVLIIDSGGAAEHCDIWTEKYNIYPGMRVCEMVQEYLDREYATAPDNSVELLLLEMVNNYENVEICAGYELIGEKFLRQYDLNEQCFIHRRTDEIVSYYDENGNLRMVEEETGGLILDNEGHAQRNPYYDPRIRLMTMSMTTGTNLEAQAAIDRFLNTPAGPDLRIVVTTTGDATVGAAERLFRCQRNKTLNVDMNKLAVFGKGDSSTMTLVRNSVEGRGLLRGYSTSQSTASFVNGISDMLAEGQTGEYAILESTRIRIDEERNIYGVATVIGSAAIDPEAFFLGGT